MISQVPKRFWGRGTSRGFSLIELLIVVAIILIIAAIAIPNFLRAKIAANNAACPTIGYAPALANLGGPVAGCVPSSATACIVDFVLASGNKSGYQFLSIGFAQGGAINNAFVASSAPQAYDVSGDRNFCVITDGVLRFNPGIPGGVPAPDVPTCQTYLTLQ